MPQDCAARRRRAPDRPSWTLRAATISPVRRRHAPAVPSIFAQALRDLAALPGNRFEALKGDRKGQYSIRINAQWRICFEWSEGSPGPVNVEIVDYH